MRKIILIAIVSMWYLPGANTTFAFGRQDSLRGSNGSGRNWWDVQHYSLHVSFDTATRSIDGMNRISSRIIATPSDSLQLDLQELMFLDSVLLDNKKLEFSKEGNVWWIKHPFSQMQKGSDLVLTVFYHGKPHPAKLPPWDGGFIWTKDATGQLWVAVACQGFGASCWWPCKDYQGDKPDLGTDIALSTPHLTVVSNGRKLESDTAAAGRTDRWTVRNPINTYNVTFYIGDYISWTDTLQGENGKLDLSFYALRSNEEKARKQFAVTKDMLRCFEYWMGPYPFYEDGYKLVEAPFLGMEHQSAIAYGNQYKMGYLGNDRSGTDVGLLFDFIIIHESGHEWFGNNITAEDIADNWLHEGFTTYTEALFTECAFGKEKAFEYTTGEWKHITNDRPVTGNYGVNDEGSGDKYDKGSAVVHMIRMILNDDEKFRQLLRGLNKDFYHKVVSSAQVEDYISKFSGHDLKPFFDQYLRTTQIPKLETYVKRKELFYRFTNAVDGFSLPVTVTGSKNSIVIYPATEWQRVKWKDGYGFEVSRDFLFKRN